MHLNSYQFKNLMMPEVKFRNYVQKIIFKIKKKWLSPHNSITAIECIEKKTL